MLFFHFFFPSGNTPIAVWGTHLDLIQNPQIRAKHGGKEHVNVSMTAELAISHRRGHVQGGDRGCLTALEAEISYCIQKRGHDLLSERLPHPLFMKEHWTKTRKEIDVMKGCSDSGLCRACFFCWLKDPCSLYWPMYNLWYLSAISMHK